MVSSPLLRKSIFISVLGHMVLFSLFSLSFGNKIPVADHVSISFLGQLLRPSHVGPPEAVLKQGSADKNKLEDIFKKNSNTMLLKTYSETTSYNFDWYLKPPPYLKTFEGKETFRARTDLLPPPSTKKKEAIIFHPLLPYSFPLYFKDRQVAHVELMFKIVPEGERNLILIKRKISSGNLEIDLLSKRHIGHYLFIQQKSFAPRNWQTVKIDLSSEAKGND
jgi:hypothetical protein